METFRPEAVYLNLEELSDLYYQFPGSHSYTGLFDFIRVWRKSAIYKIPCGYLRFEPYPRMGAATFHGIFLSNPFQHIQLVSNVLDFYLNQNPWLSQIECIVPKAYRGVIKLAKAVTSDWQEAKNNFIFYWR